MNNLNNFAGQTEEMEFNSWAGKKNFSPHPPNEVKQDLQISAKSNI